MSGGHIIVVYESMLGLILQMVEAARARDWDSLVALERQCNEIVSGLAGREPRETLEPALQRRKADVIRKMLAADAEIRTITEPWLQHLQNLLGSAAREHRLREAYAQHTTPALRGPP